MPSAVRGIQGRLSGLPVGLLSVLASSIETTPLSMHNTGSIRGEHYTDISPSRAFNVTDPIRAPSGHGEFDSRRTRGVGSIILSRILSVFALYRKVEPAKLVHLGLGRMAIDQDAELAPIRWRGNDRTSQVADRLSPVPAAG